MKKRIALSLALVMILTLCLSVHAEEARTERIGVLSLLNQSEEELVGAMIADAYYSDMLVPVALRSFVDFLQAMTAGGN